MVRARACNDPDNHLIRGSKVMTLDRIFEWTRPYAIGLGIGLFAAPIVGFNVALARTVDYIPNPNLSVAPGRGHAVALR